MRNAVATVLPFALAAVLSSCPESVACAQALAARKPASLESTVDTSVKPGDDFFAYANGSWLKATEIPVGKERWGARNEIDELTRRRLVRLLDDASRAPAGATARKVADFRAALLNEQAIAANGITPLEPLLDSIDHIGDKAALTRFLGRSMRADVDPLNWAVYRSASLLGLSVEPSIHGERTYVAFLLQGGLGLPDREQYLGTEPAMVAWRARYQAYVGRLFTHAGFEDAERRAEAVVTLETAIAQTQATREASANDHNADTVWTRADFARNAPDMDWSAFFAAAGLAKQGTFVPWQPTAVRGVAALVAAQPLETWKNYLRGRALDMYADALPGALAREAWTLRDATPNGAQPIERAQRVTNITHVAMADAIGRMYAERYFPAEQKARVQDIVGKVTAAFVHRVEAATWMSPATRTIALEKLKTLYVGIGYPERWADYSDLAIDPTDAMGNVRRVADRNYRHALALLDTPVDMKQWWIAPQTVGGILVFQQNAYEFTAALLQPTKFDPSASDAATFGAIGAMMGHDVVHFIDVLGAEYEVDGRMRRWWTADDMQRFQKTTEPLVDQYSAYRPFPDVAVNGKLALTENVADLGGLVAAFDAYRHSLGNRATDTAYVRHGEREFFIAFAQSWRSKLTDAAMRTQATTNDHAPETYRIATVRNMDAWYDAFDVRPGQRLYLAPSARVRIW
ncbi:MAG: M13 family metallopeptidase [Gemmatimonadaceae bacterium]